MMRILLSLMTFCFLTFYSKPVEAHDAAVAKELEEKRVMLEAKQKELSEKEAFLKQQEQELEAKIKKIELLRTEIVSEFDHQKKFNEERITKMVVVFESMTPKSAAGVIETLDDWVAVEILKKMDSKRMAKIMNIMDKHRSARLSELLTGYNKKATELVSKPQTVAERAPSASAGKEAGTK